MLRDSVVHVPHPALRRVVASLVGYRLAVYGDDVVAHAQLTWPEGGWIMLGSLRDDPDDRWPVQPGTAACYVVTGEPDTVHDRSVPAGAEITDPLHGTDYGSREFAARDPEGNRWSFGTYRGEPRGPR